MDPYHGPGGHPAHHAPHHAPHQGHSPHPSLASHPSHHPGPHRSYMERGLYKMSSRLPVTTYYRTMSIDNKPTTVIIGPSEYSQLSSPSRSLLNKISSYNIALWYDMIYGYGIRLSYHPLISRYYIISSYSF